MINGGPSAAAIAKKQEMSLNATDMCVLFFVCSFVFLCFASLFCFFVVFLCCVSLLCFFVVFLCFFVLFFVVVAVFFHSF